MANILELDPVSFANALNELGVDEQQEEVLLRQYREKNSSFEGLQNAIEGVTDPGENRERANVLPISKPKGMTGAEAITSGQADWAVPEFLTKGAEGVMSAVDMPAATLRGPTSKGDMQDSALETAGMMSLGSAAMPAPEGSLRMFGGRNARNFPEQNYDRAIELKQRGIDDDTIWAETGLQFDPQNRTWRFEIDSKDMDFIPDPSGAMTTDEMIEDAFETAIINRTDEFSAPIFDVIEFPALKEAYPQLEDVKFVLDPSISSIGQFDPAKKALVLNPKSKHFFTPEGDFDIESVKDVIVHELQHGVQALEGYRGGSNVLSVIRQDPEASALYDMLDDAKLRTQKLRRYVEDVQDPDMKQEAFDDFVDSLNELETIYKEYRPYEEKAFTRYLAERGEGEARAAEARRQLSPGEKAETSMERSITEANTMASRKAEPAPSLYTPWGGRNYAEGGLVMDKQMEFMFNEGGLADDGAVRDAVSGNDVPSGSMDQEVRDDVPAKLSEGEYVIPANIVRYYGVKHFENLINKAEKDLTEMESNGRIGGQAAPEDNTPPLSDTEGGPLAFAEGGSVPAFNPSQYGYGTSAALGTSTPSGGIVNKTYINKDGDKRTIMFINGNPVSKVPEGFVEDTPENREALKESSGKKDFEVNKTDESDATQRRRGTDGRERIPEGERNSKEHSLDPAKNPMNSPESLEEWVKSGIRAPVSTGSAVGAIAGTLLGGGLIQGAGGYRYGDRINDFSVLNAGARMARQAGYDDLAAEYEEQAEELGNNIGGLAGGLFKGMATGEKRSEPYITEFMSRGTSPVSSPSTSTRPVTSGPASSRISGGGGTSSLSGGTGRTASTPSLSFGNIGGDGHDSNDYSPSTSGRTNESFSDSGTDLSYGGSKSSGSKSYGGTSGGGNYNDVGSSYGAHDEDVDLGYGGGKSANIDDYGYSMGESVDDDKDDYYEQSPNGFAKGGLVKRKKTTPSKPKNKGRRGLGKK